MLADILRYFDTTFARMRPEAIVLLSFASAIAIGALLLWLPVSHNGIVSFSDALFTATSAVCVTGLIVVDTGRDFTVFGQCVILLLIELGGLGVMTFAALAFDLLGKRLSLTGQEAMTSELMHAELTHGLGFHFRRMLWLVLTIEGCGAILLFAGMVNSRGIAEGLFSAAFHSISAFCNAGFSLYPDSLIGFKNNTLVVSVISMLIVLGGIGYPVLFDLIKAIGGREDDRRPFWIRLSTHTRITLIMTLVLLISGTVLLLLIGTPDGRIDFGAAVFQSITARTAGFNTIAIERLSQASLLTIMILMFIGGSPGSCAGGVKTTTFALWISLLWHRLRGRTRVVFQDRYIAETLVRRSSTIISLAVLLNVLGIFVLSISEAHNPGIGLHDIMFEQISAFGTVGLSTGLTGQLSQPGRLWIIMTMFIGRTGPLTSVLLLLHKRPTDIRYPEGKVMIG